MNKLPNELLYKIFTQLGPSDLYVLSRTSSHWYNKIMINGYHTMSCIMDKINEYTTLPITSYYIYNFVEYYLKFSRLILISENILIQRLFLKIKYFYEKHQTIAFYKNYLEIIILYLFILTETNQMSSHPEYNVLFLREMTGCSALYRTNYIKYTNLVLYEPIKLNYTTQFLMLPTLTTIKILHQTFMYREFPNLKGTILIQPQIADSTHLVEIVEWRFVNNTDQLICDNYRNIREWLQMEYHNVYKQLREIEKDLVKPFVLVRDPLTNTLVSPTSFLWKLMPKNDNRLTDYINDEQERLVDVYFF